MQTLLKSFHVYQRGIMRKLEIEQTYKKIDQPSLVLTIKAQTPGPQEPSVRISLSKNHEGSVNETACA